MRKIIDITALSIAVCVLGMVLFLPSPVLSFKCYRGDGMGCAQLGRDKLSPAEITTAPSPLLPRLARRVRKIAALIWEPYTTARAMRRKREYFMTQRAIKTSP